MWKNMDLTIEGINNLRAAVVRQACFDYCTTLKKPGRKVHWDTKGTSKKYDTRETLERWFHSKEFKKFCSVDGEAILVQLRENHANGFRMREAD